MDVLDTTLARLEDAITEVLEAVQGSVQRLLGQGIEQVLESLVGVCVDGLNGVVGLSFGGRWSCGFFGESYAQQRQAEESELAERQHVEAAGGLSECRPLLRGTEKRETRGELSTMLD